MSSENHKKTWEIPPNAVKAPKLILSKRNELGILSNFANTPFELDGKKFTSLESFWQAMKYPENTEDARYGLVQWPHTRQEVESMDGYQAKKAGSFANAVMKKYGIEWVSYQGQKMEYRAAGESLFYKLIKRAMKAKMDQNPEVRRVLLSTGDLILLPDHHQDSKVPKAWRYYDIYTELREKAHIK